MAAKRPTAAIANVQAHVDKHAASTLLDAAISVGRASGRKFLWRLDPDLYTTLLAEVLLQNTPALRVEPVFEEMVCNWPDFENLARAELADIETILKPLGLFRRRAAALIRLAQVMTKANELANQDVRFLRELPGVGPYTAGVVAAVAGQTSSAFVDGPVARLLCRYLGIPQRKRAFSDPAVWDIATALLAIPTGFYRERAWGLIDIGREICQPVPLCRSCPVSHQCLAFGEDRSP